MRPARVRDTDGIPDPIFPDFLSLVLLYDELRERYLLFTTLLLALLTIIRLY
jgi:hypothetical protein